MAFNELLQKLREAHEAEVRAAAQQGVGVETSLALTFPSEASKASKTPKEESESESDNSDEKDEPLEQPASLGKRFSNLSNMLTNNLLPSGFSVGRTLGRSKTSPAVDLNRAVNEFRMTATNEDSETFTSTDVELNAGSGVDSNSPTALSHVYAKKETSAGFTLTHLPGALRRSFRADQAGIVPQPPPPNSIGEGTMAKRLSDGCGDKGSQQDAFDLSKRATSDSLNANAANALAAIGSRRPSVAHSNGPTPSLKRGPSQGQDRIDGVANFRRMSVANAGMQSPRSQHRRESRLKNVPLQMEEEIPTFEILDLWTVMEERKATTSISGLLQETSNSFVHRASLSRRSSRMGRNSVATPDTVAAVEGCMRHWIASPGSKRRIYWDLLGAMILAQDMIMIPLQVFDLDIEFIRPTISVFWILDIFASFFVGFYSRGTLEMRPVAIAKHYLRTWFVIDVTLAALDLCTLFVARDLAASGSSTLRIVKLTRGVRALRLLRLFKFRFAFANFSEMSQNVRSEEVRTIVYIMKLIVFIALVNHFLACGFYGISLLHFHDISWVEEKFTPADGMVYRYWTSLHWSLTQFTPAGMEVVPVNTIERAYSVCVLLFALVTFSSFVSSITTAMTHLRNINARRMEEDRHLRRWLIEHEVGSGLRSQIMHYLAERRSHDTALSRIKEEDVTLMKLLPESLKHQLRVEAFLPVIIHHPLFHLLRDADRELVNSICCTAVTERRLVIRHELYGHGAELTHMLFIQEGIVTYTYKVNNLSTTERLRKGSWACEAALWARCPPQHCAPFVAESNCEFALLSAVDFGTACKNRPDIGQTVGTYARLFVEMAAHIIESCPQQSMVCTSNLEIAQELVADAMVAVVDSEAEAEEESEEDQGGWLQGWTLPMQLGMGKLKLGLTGEHNGTSSRTSHESRTPSKSTNEDGDHHKRGSARSSTYSDAPSSKRGSWDAPSSKRGSWDYYSSRRGSKEHGSRRGSWVGGFSRTSSMNRRTSQRKKEDGRSSLASQQVQEAGCAKEEAPKQAMQAVDLTSDKSPGVQEQSQDSHAKGEVHYVLSSNLSDRSPSLQDDTPLTGVLPS